MMSKIVVEYDTVDKTLSVTMDGKPIEDLTDVSFYVDSYDGSAHCHVHSMKRDKETDTVVHTTVYASTQEKEAIAKAIAKMVFPNS